MCDAGVLRLCYISCSRMYSQSQSAHVPVISRDGACSTFLKKKNDYIPLINIEILSISHLLIFLQEICTCIYNDKTGQATIRMNRQAVLKR